MKGENGQPDEERLTRACRGVVIAAEQGDANAFGKIRDTIDGPPVARAAVVVGVVTPETSPALAAALDVLNARLGLLPDAAQSDE